MSQSGFKCFTDVEGVFANAVHCGLKENDRDLVFIYVPDAVGSAGIFTLNRFSAPSVQHTKACMKANTLKAVIINSGNANTGNGEEGDRNNRLISEQASKLLSLDPKEVGVASTGVIGRQLAMDAIVPGLDVLLKDVKAKQGRFAAEGILTTDTGVKEVFESVAINGADVVVSGISKGSGMIAPNMATTLSFLVTSADIPSSLLQEWLQEAADDTFNMLSVDTDTSTSDMVLIFATGQHKIDLEDAAQVALFKSALYRACEGLTRLIARDGEGATKMLIVNVEGARTKADARRVAKLIVDSPLVKTAVHGADPNWGRVLMAAGKDPDVDLDPTVVDLNFGDQCIFEQGMPKDVDLERLMAYLKQDTVEIRFKMNRGQATATAWGCDLTKGYIDINTTYT